MGNTSFTQLDVWKKAHQVVLQIHKTPRGFPDDERYGLTRQMRSAAVSVPANIAEGFGRRKAPDKARFYNIGEGSAEELKYYLILARDLQYRAESKGLWAPLEDVSRMLRRLTQATLRDS